MGTTGLGPPGTELVVVRRGATRAIPVRADRGYDAAPAAALAEALGYAWLGGVMVLDGEPVRFFRDSPFFTVGESVFQLANPAYGEGSHLMVPVGWALDWLPSARSRRWQYLDGRLVEQPQPRPAHRRSGKWVVVIDPGHGGVDPGAVGVSGAREKDITLAVARRLSKRLERERDIEIIMTRDRDTLIALADRPRIARLRGADRTPDLFLSIHANSMPRKPHETRGFETYFLAVAKTEEALRVALRENASLQFEGRTVPEDLNPLQYILSDLQLAGNLQESSLLSAAVNRGLRATLRTPDLGVKQGPFTVLVGATMPAALVEIGYLSNRSEEKLLRSPSYQAKIADALADAIVNYLAEYGGRVWSSPAGGG